MLETKLPIAAADLCDCWVPDLKSAKHKLVSIAFRGSRSYNSEPIATSLQIVHNEVAERRKVRDPHILEAVEANLEDTRELVLKRVHIEISS